MSNKNKKSKVAESATAGNTIVETATAEQQAASTSTNNQPIVGIVGLTLPKGRPTDPNSKRQLMLKARAEGAVGKRGRPANPDSKRQLALKAKAEGAVGIKTGRPVNANSARQIKLAARAEKLKQLAAQMNSTPAPVTEA